MAVGGVQPFRGEPHAVVLDPDQEASVPRLQAHAHGGGPGVLLHVREGLLDGYLDLTEPFLREGIRLRDVQCPYDEHFCEKGNQWLATHILDFLDPAP